MFQNYDNSNGKEKKENTNAICILINGLRCPIGKTIHGRFKFQLVIPWSAVISNPPNKRSLHRSMILFKEGTDITS